MKKLANEAQTPVTEKTDLKAQLAEVAERIRTMREIIGLSEEEMAQRTGVTLEEYRGFESGEHDFSFTFIFKCAERFGIDPTDLIKGKTIDEALKLTNKAVVEALEGLPPIKVHCSVLAEQAVKAALSDYYRRQGIDPEPIVGKLEEDCDHCESCGH